MCWVNPGLIGAVVEVEVLTLLSDEQPTIGHAGELLKVLTDEVQKRVRRQSGREF